MKEQPIPIDELLAEKRAGLIRLSPEEAALQMASGSLLIDIRYLEQKLRDGVIPGAVQVNTNELEWRCNPSTEDRYRSPRIIRNDYDQPLMIFCNQGCQSSLKAAALQELGLQSVTDVIGGFEAWEAAGLPYKPPNVLHKLGAKVIRLADKVSK